MPKQLSACGYTCKLEWKGEPDVNEQMDINPANGGSWHGPGPSNKRPAGDRPLKQRVDWKPAPRQAYLLLRRLVKGALKTTQEGRAFIYALIRNKTRWTRRRPALRRHVTARCWWARRLSIVERSTCRWQTCRTAKPSLAEKLKTAPDAVPYVRIR